LIEVTSPDDIANGVKVQKGGYCCAKKYAVRVISPENIENGARL
jgi:hypothetical protein